MNPHLGLALALATLAAWSLSPFFFTACGRRIGPMATNLLRLLFSCLFLLALTAARALFFGGMGTHDWRAYAWLAGSGAMGLALGDFFLYRSFVDLGPERTSQIQTLAPAFTVGLAALFLSEFLSAMQLLGMALILSGVFLVTWKAAHRTESPDRPIFVVQGPVWLHGAWAAAWSAMFQGMGTVMARHAFLMSPHLDPVTATTLRIGAGTVALWAFARLRGPIRPLLGDWRRPAVLKRLLAGTALGPILGMLGYVSALKFAPAGIVTVITFMTPLIIIPLGAWHYGRRITAATVAGTALSLAGVVLLGLA